MEAPTGTFRIEFREGVGHVRQLQTGGSTTIVRKGEVDHTSESRGLRLGVKLGILAGLTNQK
jgi:hypothetical protein